MIPLMLGKSNSKWLEYPFNINSIIIQYVKGCVYSTKMINSNTIFYFIFF